MCDKVTDGLTKDLTDGMPECPCHCDIHPGNVKWKDGKCVGLYDFDWSNWIIACLTFVLPWFILVLPGKRKPTDAFGLIAVATTLTAIINF